MTTMPPCTLRLLGRVELRDAEGRALPLRTRKTALVLAMLALDGTMRRDAVAGAVWEASEGTSGREGLRTALSVLRKVLPEGAIRSEGDRIALEESTLRIEPFRAEDGDFMPGHETDWAVDRRLALRAVFVAEALDRARAARSAGRTDEALNETARACALDPLDAAAAALRAELLREAGRTAEALARGDAFRARVVRELGLLPEEPVPPPRATENPLVAAVEWTLARDPEEACVLLAGTQEQWRVGSFERALDLHRRVLEAASRPTAARRIVESGQSFFAAMLDPASVRSGRLEAMYRASLESREPAVSDPLCEALAYGSLSTGQFEAACVYAREGLDVARRRGDASGIGRWELHRGILELHAGDAPGCFRHMDQAVARLESTGSTLDGLTAQGARIGNWIQRGWLDRAAARLDEYRRRVAAYGGERLEVWTHEMEGVLHERAGDLPRAKAAYLRFQERAPAMGQCAVASADDALMRVDCALGEYDVALDALARNVDYRRRKGSVASAHERKTNAPAVRRLRERLGEEEFRAALRRVASPA